MAICVCVKETFLPTHIMSGPMTVSIMSDSVYIRYLGFICVVGKISFTILPTTVVLSIRGQFSYYSVTLWPLLILVNNSGYNSIYPRLFPTVAVTIVTATMFLVFLPYGGNVCVK